MSVPTCPFKASINGIYPSNPHGNFDSYESLPNFEHLVKKCEGNTLYIKLGKFEGIQKLAKRVYQYHTQDDRISEFFDCTMISRFERMLINFVIGLLGGETYNRRSMIKAHRRLGGLSDDHFDAFKDNFKLAMKHERVDDDCILKMMDVVEGTRDDVMGLTKLERKALESNANAKKGSTKDKRSSKNKPFKLNWWLKIFHIKS